MITRHTTYNQMDGLQLLLQHWGPRLIIFYIIGIVIWHSIIGWQWHDFLFVFIALLLRGLVEWPVHRYVLHASPLPLLKWRLESPLSAAHIDHHSVINDDKDLNFSGKAITALALLLFFFLWPFCSLDILLDIELYLLLHLLFYEYCHILSHSNVSPAWQWLDRILQIHRLHHKAGHWHEDYGMTSALADKLLNTHRATDNQ